MTKKLKEWSESWQAEVYKMVIGTLILAVLSLVAVNWNRAINKLDTTTDVAYENKNNAISMCKDIETNKVYIKENRYNIDKLRMRE